MRESEHRHKRREINFSRFPPGQVGEAAGYLQSQEPVEQASPVDEKLAVDVSYDLNRTCLKDIESHLEDRGFHLSNTLMSKLMRAIVYYMEDTELHNAHAPSRPSGRVKQSPSEVYAQAWEHHPHGDSDDTPPEWREYR